MSQNTRSEPGRGRSRQSETDQDGESVSFCFGIALRNAGFPVFRPLSRRSAESGRESDAGFDLVADTAQSRFPAAGAVGMALRVFRERTVRVSTSDKPVGAVPRQSR